MAKTRVLLADDHTLVAELCKRLLDTDFEVIGIATDGHALIQIATDLRPEVIIVDIAMPGLNGLDAAQRVKRILTSVKVIFLTMNPDPELAAEAFNRGASGYLLKTSSTTELVLSVREVLKGKSFLSSCLSRDAVDMYRWQHKTLVEEANRLTERQREVLQLLAQGKVMKEVASTLKMSTRTVAFHKYRIMEVLGAKSSADLVKYAVRNHMVPS